MSTQAHCTLCRLPTSHPLTNDDGDPFCCPACLEVSGLLADTPRTQAETEMKSATAVENTTISLSGLWCPSCAWLINERLTRSQGVQSANVNFIQREALVTYNPAQTTPHHLVRQIKKIGYGARLDSDDPANEEEKVWNLLLITGVLAMHIMILSFMLYFREWTGRATLETEWLANIFRLMIAAMSVPVIVIAGLPILRAGTVSLLRGRPNTHTLITIGAFAAFGLSVYNLVSGQGDVYFDTAAILLFLLTIGHWLELRAQRISSEAVKRLWQQMPTEATWLTAAGWQTTPASAVPIGARVRIRPGERFPVDGLIVEGQGDIDKSVVTGESDPVLHCKGDEALAGTVNLDGAFELIATAVGQETIIGQIGHLLHQALWQRAPVEQTADKLAARLVPLAVSLSLLAFAFWTWRAGVDTGLTHALSVLLIACPCALGIATPLTLWIGLGRAAKAGVIVRYTAVLERLAAVKQITFDKTGTLTKRPIQLQKVLADGLSDADFLTRIAAIEALSEHPLAQAAVNGAWQQWHLSAPESGVSHFRTQPGQGVSANWRNEPTWIGNQQLMADNALFLPFSLQEIALRWLDEGLTVIYAGWHGRVRGLLGFGERIRDEVSDTFSQLQQLGLPVSILTGDNIAAGDRWQQALEVPVQAEQRPQDKVAQLQKNDGSVAMVGDGINDGPALAAASVGIAVRQGTDVAQSAADVILLNDDLSAVPWLIALSRTAMRKVRHNLLWSVGYNSIGLLLALTGHLQPSLAALLMVLSNLIVTSNALHLRKARIGFQPHQEVPADEHIDYKSVGSLGTHGVPRKT